MRIETSKSSWLTRKREVRLDPQKREARLQTHAFARVLEHFPMTRKTRLEASHLRENGTFFDWNKAIETHPAEDAANHAEKGHR
jgi:hypothetical protein